MPNDRVPHAGPGCGKARPTARPLPAATGPGRKPAAPPGGRWDRPAHLVILGQAAGSETLLRVAAELAGQAGAALHVVRSHDPAPPGELEAVRRLYPRDAGGPLADARQELARASRFLEDCTGLPVSSDLLVGPPDPTLTDYVRANGFDLVLAAAGARRRPWLGGTWSRVAGQRPVLIVGPGVAPSWPARIDREGEVLVPLDGTAGAEDIIAPAVSLCRLLGARLTLLRVAAAIARPSRLRRCFDALVGKRLPTRDGSFDHGRYLRDLARSVRRHVPAVRTITAVGRPADVILDVQRASRAVVAMAAPTRWRVTSLVPGPVGAEVLGRATAPVLFYRPVVAGSVFGRKGGSRCA